MGHNIPKPPMKPKITVKPINKCPNKEVEFSETELLRRVGGFADEINASDLLSSGSYDSSSFYDSFSGGGGDSGGGGASGSW